MDTRDKRDGTRKITGVHGGLRPRVGYGRGEESVNYLAHAVLGRASDAHLLGGFLGDFVRGRVVDDDWPPGVGAGIRLHRAVDAATDAHAAFRACRQAVAPRRRRLAGIIVDLCWDHCLVRDWQIHCPGLAFDPFVERCYATLARANMGGALAAVAPPFFPVVARMREQDWLRGYATMEGMAETFRRVARRAEFLAPLEDGIDDLASHLPEFRAGLTQLWEDLGRVSVGQA
ncbi:ACP phosphodiesterase [soil metagenome]